MSQAYSHTNEVTEMKTKNVAQLQIIKINKNIYTKGHVHKHTAK